MKKFKFSLEKVLDFKSQNLDVKNNEMMKLQADLRELEARIARLNEDFQKTNQKMVQELQGGLSPMDMAAYKVYLHEINQKTQHCKAEKAALQQVIEKKMALILELKTDISGLERLKDKQIDTYLAGVQKEQEVALEEFVSRSRYYAV